MARTAYYQKSAEPQHIAGADGFWAQMEDYRKKWFAFAQHFGTDKVYFSNYTYRFIGLGFAGVASKPYGPGAWKKVYARSAADCPKRSGQGHSKELIADWDARIKELPGDCSLNLLAEALGKPEPLDPFADSFGCDRVIKDKVTELVLVKATFLIPGFTEITASEYETLKGKDDNDEH